MPRVRKEHVGTMQSEAAASYVPHLSTKSQPSAALSAVRMMAPGGGSSALGTAPMPVPGNKTVSAMPTLYDSLLSVRSAS